MMQPVPPQATSRDWPKAEYKDPYVEADDLQLHSNTHSCLVFFLLPLPLSTSFTTTRPTIMSDSLTNQRHNDFVGGEGSKGRIPGANDATSGHYFVAVDPKPGECAAYPTGV